MPNQPTITPLFPKTAEIALKDNNRAIKRIQLHWKAAACWPIFNLLNEYYKVISSYQRQCDSLIAEREKLCPNRCWIASPSSIVHNSAGLLRLTKCLLLKSPAEDRWSCLLFCFEKNLFHGLQWKWIYPTSQIICLDWIWQGSSQPFPGWRELLYQRISVATQGH